jgi:hypothetical protein
VAFVTPVFLDTTILLGGLIDFGSTSAEAQHILDSIAAGSIVHPKTAWHCCLEFFAVATRLPPAFRLSPEQASLLLEDFTSRVEIEQLPEKAQIEEMLQKARRAFVHWREESFASRADLMKKVSNYLIQNKQRFSSIIMKEMGWSLLNHDCHLAASSIPAMDGSFQISAFGNL